MDALPFELITHIYGYIPLHWKITYNKTSFLKYYPATSVGIQNKDSHIRDVIRNDRALVFNALLGINYNRWRSLKSWTYRSWTFPDYVSYIYHLCSEYGHNKCRNGLVMHEKELGVYKKKKHKKVRLKDSRWSN